MQTYLLYSLTGGLLFCIGFLGLIFQPNLVRKIISLNVMGSGVFLLLISIAKRNSTVIPDPVPHAMVLTGIVVALAITAFALGLARRIYTKTGYAALPEDYGEEEKVASLDRESSL